MNCCENCFDDKHLKNQVKFLSWADGTCDFCNSLQVPLIEPILLREQFELITGLYTSNPTGKFLVELIQDDWQIFCHDNLDAHKMRSLLSEIMDDGEIVRGKFNPPINPSIDASTRWHEFRIELMHTNRYFPEPALRLDELEALLVHLLVKSIDIPQQWYRARINFDNPFCIDQMGAPPKHLASHGRANPAGIPYLYLASTEQTAVSEIRPHTGDVVTVANINLNDGLVIADLRNPRRTISPFLIGDEEGITKIHSFIGFLEQLGEELTRPVLPRSAAFDYAPSQYLCEFIKKCNYSGVIYSSSVGDGFNLALFNPELATVTNVYQKAVTRISVSTS